MTEIISAVISFYGIIIRITADIGVYAADSCIRVPEYRFVLISDRGSDTANEQLCIPEPMAGPDCILYRKNMIRMSIVT